jgi:cellulose 1,4-beta-cellobiosidase
VNTDSGAWTITQTGFNSSPGNGAPATYPSTFKGCHWGLCTSGSGLPIQVSQLGSATSSWSTNQVPSGKYDVAYDLWFNSTPTTSGQPDGTEIMIWINSRGGVQPFGSQTGTANLAGYNWNVWTGNQTSWKIISYVLQGGATSVNNLDIKALINDAVARGSLNPAHYLIDSEVGFEIWQGGQGLGTNSYSFTATQGGGGNPPPPNGGCSATWHTDNDWGSGFTATVTVTNTSANPANGWAVHWTWPGNQNLTGGWNANLVQSGRTVDAGNMSYNGYLAPGGGSTTFGVQGTYSGTNTPPQVICGHS